jgi:hypothetical protein
MSEINTQQTLELWAMYTIKEWLKKIRELNIGKTGHLASSFEATVVTSAGGNIEKVLFAFEYYGQMIDWGVGKGVPVELRDALNASGLSKRKKKEWFKQFYHEVAVLKYVYAERYEAGINSMITGSFS